VVGSTVADNDAVGALEAEDRARANFYGLISRLFYAPADPNLLAEICGSGAAGEGGGGLYGAWRGLQEACQSAYPAVVRQEYDNLFVGVGRAAVTPYLSGYAETSSPDRYLVRLREQLAAWGLGRREGVFEVEDHISGVSDVMRWLIQERRPLEQQREFFEVFVYRGAIPFCAAVHKTPLASFYEPVAAFAAAFFEIEKKAFEMLDLARAGDT
jgi:TorA maturation chaperone TorD